MKIFKNLMIFTCFLGASLGTGQAMAIDMPDPCQMVAEEIIPLRVPNFDQAAMWKKISGVKGIDRPRALLPVLDGGQIAIGASTRYDEKIGLSTPEIQMVRTDKTGKIIVERWNTIQNLKSVTDAILLKDRIVVLSQIGNDKDDMISLSFINGAGELKSTKIINNPKLRLVPKSLMSVVGGAKMVIAAEGISRKNPADSYTVLIWVDKDGNQITIKEYLPGVRNKPDYVGRLDNDEIVVTGRVQTEKGNDAGWILRLSPKGEIIYQRPYARGGDSVLRRAISTGSGSMIVVGDALPSGAGDKAGWVMKVDGDGTPIWQKYLIGKYSYGAVDVVDLNDGRLNILLNGKPAGQGGRNYARIVTLSTNGVVIGDESFIEGSNAIPTRLISQNGKRVLLGLAETGFSKDNSADDLKYVTYDTWVLGLAGLPEYKDSCAGSTKRNLDDMP